MYPILLRIGSWELRSYGVFVAIALLIGLWWSTREGERRGFSRGVITDFAAATMIAGFIGARLYYVLFSEPQAYRAHPWEIFAVWHGGLAMHGGLLAGLMFAVWYVRRHRLSFLRLGDVVAPGLILGQTVGQIACLLNGDTYGKPTTLPWALTFTDQHALAPLGVPLHPIQIYELLAYAVVFGIVYRVARAHVADGTTLATYAIAYGVARFGMEFFRGDPPMLGDVVVPQLVSAGFVLAGLVGLWLIHTPSWRSHEHRRA